jgi:glutathione peroxidase
MPDSLFEIPLTRLDGSPDALGAYAGKVLLLVNVASKCGLTPQYDGLEKLYRDYRDRGLVVLGFPANDFSGQEPGSNEEISEFCRSIFGVDFPMFSKITVTGPAKHPLYKALIKSRPDAQFKQGSTLRDHLPKMGLGADEVHWNFEKFLIGRDGTVVGRFAPDTAPQDEAIVGAIERALAR